MNATRMGIFPKLSFVPPVMRSERVSAMNVTYYEWERTVKAQTILPPAKDLT
jgi:hypothetical protein